MLMTFKPHALSEQTAQLLATPPGWVAVTSRHQMRWALRITVVARTATVQDRTLPGNICTGTTSSTSALQISCLGPMAGMICIGASNTNETRCALLQG